MNYFQRFDEELIQIIIIKMVNALSELYRKGVVHHDIKPENILVQLFPDEKITPELEKKIETIKEAIDKYEAQINSQTQNNNSFPYKYNNILPNNNIINQNNNYYMNNNVPYNNPYMEYNYPMNYNINIPPIQHNQFNNYNNNYNI